MIQSALAIYNAAISAAGGKGRLTSLTQNSNERQECDIWYEHVVRTIQSAAYWPSSMAQSRLALLSEATTLWVEGRPLNYSYAYALPSDLLHPWYLTNYAPFEFFYDPVEGRTMLQTNAAQAILVYARLNLQPATWSPTQLNATIYALAAHISTGIGRTSERRDRNLQLANELLLQAQASAANAPNLLQEVIPPTILARGAAGQSPPQYTYPLGAVFTGTTGLN